MKSSAKHQIDNARALTLFCLADLSSCWNIRWFLWWHHFLTFLACTQDFVTIILTVFHIVLLKCFRISSRLPLDDVESIEQLVFNVTSSTGFDFALSSVDVRFVASLCVFLASLCSSKCRRCICVAAFPAFFCDVESIDELNLQQTSIISVWVELGLSCWKYVYCSFLQFCLSVFTSDVFVLNWCWSSS